MPESLPPARKSLEALAQRLMASGLSPEEYAERHGAQVLMCSIHRYQYERAETTAWMHRLGEILTSEAWERQQQDEEL